MRFRVLSPLQYGAPDGAVTRYEPDSIADLSEAAAAQAVELGTLVADPEPEPAPDPDPPAQPRQRS